MTDQELRIIASEVLLKLEGDERISDILGETIMETLEEYGYDDGGKEGTFGAFMDLASNISLYSNL
jgi:hypothetical protein